MTSNLCILAKTYLWSAIHHLVAYEAYLLNRNTRFLFWISFAGHFSALPSHETLLLPKHLIFKIKLSISINYKLSVSWRKYQVKLDYTISLSISKHAAHTKWRKLPYKEIMCTNRNSADIAWNVILNNTLEVQDRNKWLAEFYKTTKKT